MKLFCLTLIVFFLTSNGVYSQDIAKDTIQLSNVNINKNKNRVKSKSIGGLCNSYEPFKQTQGVITLVEGLPLGYLHSVTFSFNNPYDKSQAEFQDAEIELLFFEANSDNTPGQRIEHDKKILMIKKEFSGKMEIDIRSLAIRSDGKMFIGLRNLTKNRGAIMQFEVDCTCIGKKNKYISFQRYDEVSDWTKTEYTLDAIKMKVKVGI